MIVIDSSGSSNDQQPTETSFTCLWRKPQTRQRKTWEGDAILHLRGKSCIVRSAEDGEQIASGPWPAGRECTSGTQFMVEGIEIQIDQPTSPSSGSDIKKSSNINSVQKGKTVVGSKAVQSTFKIPSSSSLAPPNNSSKLNLKFKSPMQVGSSSSNSSKPTSSNFSSKYFPASNTNKPFNLTGTSPKLLKRTVIEIEDDVPPMKPKSLSLSFDVTKRFKPSSTTSRENSPQNGHQKSTEDRPLSNYICLYRKTHGLGTKKNITWDGDGYLSLFKSQRGEMAVLKDANNGKSLGNMLLGLKLTLKPGFKLKVGSREIEIQRSATDEEVSRLERASVNHQDTDWSEIVKSNRINSEFKNPMKADHSSHRTGEPMHDPNAPGAVVLTRPDSMWLAKNNPKNVDVVDVVLDPLISRSLRPHQIDGVKFMYECAMGMREVGGHGCILADEMGLGKSLQAIALLWTLIRQSPLGGQGPVVKRAMIVCPVTLVKNWAREINKWLGRSRLNVFVADGKVPIRHFTAGNTYKVLIIGYEKLRVLSKEINSIYPPIGLIIADEGHRLKSIEAKTTQALRTLKTNRRIVLSGTPIQNNLTEYFAMVDFVNPGILGDYRSFKKRFEQPILKSREPNCTIAQKAIGETRADELAQLSKNYVLRRGSEMIAQHLPPRHDYCVFVSLTNVQRKIYEAIIASPEIREVFSGDVSQHLVLINTLKKLCNSPGLLMDEKSIASLAEISSSLLPAWATRDDVELSGKLIALAEFLSVLRKKDEEKIIVVSNYTKTLDIIETHCRVKRYSFCRLDGKTPQNQRDTIVQSFNRSSARAQFVFLLSSKSGGVGLNLIGASRLILFDGDWNPATDLQAMARIWRQGQQKPCHIYRFLLTGTIDECVFQRQVTKMGLATDLMNDPKAGEEFSGGGGNTFTKDELRKLFELNGETNCHTHDLLGCRCLNDKVMNGFEENNPYDRQRSPKLNRIKTKGEEEEDDDDEDDGDEIIEIGRGKRFKKSDGYEFGDDEDESLPELGDRIGFLPASQYRPLNFQDQQKVRKKLVELETWLHIDPTRNEHNKTEKKNRSMIKVGEGMKNEDFDFEGEDDDYDEKEDLKDLLEDEILNEMILNQQKKDSDEDHYGDGGEFEEEVVKDDRDDEVVIVGQRGFKDKKKVVRGGCITFVFRKTNTVV